MNDITDTIEPSVNKTGSPASPQGQVREAQLRWDCMANCRPIWASSSTAPSGNTSAGC
jgi:hypothetical protein